MNSHQEFRREQFRTMKEIAKTLGVPYYQIVRAVRAGLIPHYRLSNSKKYLLLSDVLAAMKKHGGQVGDFRENAGDPPDTPTLDGMKRIGGLS